MIGAPFAPNVPQAQKSFWMHMMDVTPLVFLNPKICHVIICIAHHYCVSENFDMHSLKQVYFYAYVLNCMDESSS